MAGKDASFLIRNRVHDYVEMFRMFSHFVVVNGASGGEDGFDLLTGKHIDSISKRKERVADDSGSFERR